MELRVWAGQAILTAGLLWIMAMAWGAGHFALRLLRPGGLRPLESIALATGLGLGLLSLSLLFLGLGGLYRPEVFATLCLLLTAAALLALRDGRQEGERSAGSEGPRWGASRVAALGVPLVVLTWLTALSPPIFHDALEYHLAVPNIYLLRGGIEPLPHVVLSNYPFGTEMLYALALWAGGIRLAVLVNFGLGLLSAFALAALAERWWGRDTALLGSLLYATTPMMILISRYATSETAMSLYVILLLLCLLRWREEGGRRWVLLAGLFGGFAFGTKLVAGFFALLLPVLLIAATALRPPQPRPLREGARALLLFLAGALAAGLPWLLKNYLYTGNPVYPALSALFPSGLWSPAQEKMLTGSANASWMIAGGWTDYLLLPWRLTVGDRGLGAASRPLLLLPLFLAAALAALFRSKDRRERFLAAATLLFFLLWAASFWMARFLLPATGLGAVLVALVFTRHLPVPLRGRPAKTAVLLLLLSSLLVVLRDAPTRLSLAPSLGLASQSDYLRGLLRSYAAVEFVNGTLPGEAKILVLGETKVAYLRRDHLYQTVFDRPLLDSLLEGISPGKEMVSALRSRGLTHVLLNLEELERLERMRRDLPFSNERLKALLDLLRTRGRLVHSGNRVFLFEL